MLLGTEPLAAIAALDPLAIDVFGMNCATGPEDMREHVRTLSRHSACRSASIPNAGIPYLESTARRSTRSTRPASPPPSASSCPSSASASSADAAAPRPTHLAAVVAAVEGLTPAPRVLDRPVPREARRRRGAVAAEMTAPTRRRAHARRRSCRVPAGVGVVVRRGDPGAGQRVPRHRRARQRQRLQGVPRPAAGRGLGCHGAFAKSQTREGAHVLDVCVDYVGRDGVPDMVAIVDRYATQSTLPLVIDSTELDVVEAALVRLGGRAVINSVNLEDGRNKVDRLLPLAKRYGAAVVVLAIDEEGQARTADWKVDVCERIARIAIDEFGLEPHDLIFDCLTFPLGSGQEDLRGDALATIEAIERVKQRVPGCFTTLGVSNVSFGLVPGRAAGPQLGVPQGGHGPRAGLRDRAPGQDPAAAPHPRRAGRRSRSISIHDRRGDGRDSAGPPSGREVRPAAPVHGAVRGRDRGHGVRRGRSRPCRSRSGCTGGSSTANATGMEADLDEALRRTPAAGHHQQLPARRA